MGWFGRKNRQDDLVDDQDEIDYEEKKSELRDNLRFRRKLRDLNPENKKLRKEPVKPWGKTERIIVGGTFLAMSIASGILAFASNGYELPKIPTLKVGIVDFDQFNPFREQVVSTRNNNKNKLNQINQDILKNFVDQTKKMSGHYSFYYLDIQSNLNISFNPSKKTTAASLMKLPVMYSFYKEAMLDKQNLDDKYVLKNADKIKGSGSLHLKPAGTVLTYRDLLRLMGKESDNTAYNVVRKKIGDEVVNIYMDKLGMENTNISDNTTTPEDIAKVLKAIYLLPDRERKEVMSFLTSTIYEEIIPKKLPKDIVVSHKFGKETSVVNDAGIIMFNSKPYILVLMSDGVVDSQAYEFLPNFSKYIYDVNLKIN